MKLRLLLLLAASACLGSLAARAEELAPRDIWPQATSAADAGNVDAAAKKTSELTEVGKSFGIRTYPVYAVSASALSRQAAKQGNKSAAEWGAKAADALDPDLARRRLHARRRRRRREELGGGAARTLRADSPTSFATTARGFSAAPIS